MPPYLIKHCAKTEILRRLPITLKVVKNEIITGDLRYNPYICSHITNPTFMEILLQNLKKSFGEMTAVDIPSFTIHTGDILGLVGNNGAGKTTLFRLLLDLIEATEGNIQMTFSHHISKPAPTHPTLSWEEEHDDRLVIDPTQSEEWKKYTGAYIDEGFLINFLTPEEYLDFIAKVNNIPAIDWSHLNSDQSDGDRTHDTDPQTATPASSHSDIPSAMPPLKALLLQFAAGELFGKKKLIRDFSAGNKQKIGIIAALYARPQLLILDEPFNFLDPSSQNLLKHILTSYHDETGATILVSSHNLQHTIDISTRIALLEHGHIINDLPNVNGSARTALEDYFKV